VLVLDRTLALERIIARAADRGVPEQFALAAPLPASAPAWLASIDDEPPPLVPWLRVDAPRTAPVLVAAPML